MMNSCWKCAMNSWIFVDEKKVGFLYYQTRAKKIKGKGERKKRGVELMP